MSRRYYAKLVELCRVPLPFVQSATDDSYRPLPHLGPVYQTLTICEQVLFGNSFGRHELIVLL